MGFFDNFTIDSAKSKFRDEYFTSLLAISPVIILAIITYANENWFHFRTYTTSYQVIMFGLSTIAGYLTYNFVLAFIRNNELSFSESFYPQTKPIYYLVYAVVLYGINWVLAQWFGTVENAEFLFTVVRPFGDFIGGASTQFGLIVRLLIAFNIITIFFVEIGLVIAHKFAFIPFLIIDEKNPIEAVTESWNNTTPNTALVLKTFNYIFYIVLIVLNIYIFMVTLVSSVGFIQFLTVLFVLVLYLYVMPFAYTVFGQLYEEVN